MHLFLQNDILQIHGFLFTHVVDFPGRLPVKVHFGDPNKFPVQDYRGYPVLEIGKYQHVIKSLRGILKIRAQHQVHHDVADQQNQQRQVPYQLDALDDVRLLLVVDGLEHVLPLAGLAVHGGVDRLAVHQANAFLYQAIFRLVGRGVLLIGNFILKSFQLSGVEARRISSLAGGYFVVGVLLNERCLRRAFPLNEILLLVLLLVQLLLT